MRFLVVGAGAVGGYFGGRLLEIGRDVTFLVRKTRAAQIAERGLAINSPAGDARLVSPPTVAANGLDQTFDVIILSCKAYHLEEAIRDFAPAVGPQTLIVPLLNGMRHLEILDERFGPERVAGGCCFISARLNGHGGIDHLSAAHRLTVGPRSNNHADQTRAIVEAMRPATFEARHSDDVVLDMWEKWAFLAAFAGITCLMRAAIGEIISAGGLGMIREMAEECRQIAADAGSPPRDNEWDWMVGHLTQPGSTMTASMLADLEHHAPTEADHILGDMLRRRRDVSDPDRSLLAITHTAIQAATLRTAAAATSAQDRNRTCTRFNPH